MKFLTFYHSAHGSVDCGNPQIFPNFPLLFVVFPVRTCRVGRLWAEKTAETGAQTFLFCLRAKKSAGNVGWFAQ